MRIDPKALKSLSTGFKFRALKHATVEIRDRRFKRLSRNGTADPEKKNWVAIDQEALGWCFMSN